MANWAVLRAAWVDLTELAALELQKIDTFLTKVPNFMDGSSHNSAAQVQLGGAGLKLNGPTALEIPAGAIATWSGNGAAHFGTSSSLRMQSGSIFITDVGSISLISGSWEQTAGTALWDVGTTATFNGAVNLNANIGLGAAGNFNISGALVYLSTATADMFSGAVFEFHSGSHLNFDGGSFISIAASTTFDLFSTMTVRSGGLIDVRSGAAITVAGAITLSGSGVITVASGTDINVQSGGAVNYNSGSSVTGSKTDSSTTLQTGPITMSGDDGRIGWRILAFDGASGRPDGDQNATFNTWKYDVIVSSTLTTNRTWRMTAPPANHQDKVKIINPTGSTLTVKDDGTGSTINTVGGGGIAEYAYANGSNGVSAGWFEVG